MALSRTTTTALGVIAAAICLATSAPVVEAQDAWRHNRLVLLLAEGKTVFGSFADNKTPEGAAQIARNDQIDFVFYDMEHSPLDIPQMRVFLQFLIDPAALLEAGRPGTNHPVLVRIPANGREMNQWMIKNILDQGAHGIVVPHVETAEQALNIVRGMRYPQKPGAPDFEPAGQRGAGPGNAVRYWGIRSQQYMVKADLWPLDPVGELVNMLLIENQLGVSNAREIARTKGVSIIAAAPGDLGVAYAGDRDAVERAIQTVLAAATEFGVPCAITAGANDVEQRIKQGFRVIITGGEGLTIGRRVAGR